MRGEELLVEAHVRVAFISGGRARPIPKPLRIAMKADQDAAQSLTPYCRTHKTGGWNRVAPYIHPAMSDLGFASV